MYKQEAESPRSPFYEPLSSRFLPKKRYWTPVQLKYGNQMRGSRSFAQMFSCLRWFSFFVLLEFRAFVWLAGHRKGLDNHSPSAAALRPGAQLKKKTYAVRQRTVSCLFLVLDRCLVHRLFPSFWAVAYIAATGLWSQLLFSISFL